MNDTLVERLSALSGLAPAAAVALWWLGSTRLALDAGSDAGRSAADALQALWLARAVLLPVLGVRVGARRGWRTGTVSALAFLAPSWPVLVLAWSASTTTLAQVAWAECGLLAAAVVLPLVGRGLRRTLPAEIAGVMAAGLGIAMAASVWLARGVWPLPRG